MSRIGKQPIQIPAGVTVTAEKSLVTVKGPKGELKKELHPNMIIEVKENEVIVTRPNDNKLNRSLHGLTRSLIANMVEGVSKGFEKKLEIVGVGYRAKANKSTINLSLGYSHPIDYTHEGVEFQMDEKNKNIIIVSGIDKEVVGQAAAKVRSFRKPEPYKGKGIRYVGEHIIRKAGKTAAK